MEPKLCPECGANVEGLIHHCDCCGTLLNPVKTMFHTMVYEAGPFFDIAQHLGVIFDKLDKISPEPYSNVLDRIVFDFWCFPIKKKTGVSYYPSRKQVIVTIEIDADEYLYGTKEEKLALLTREVKEKMDILHKRLIKRNIHIEDLFLQIDNALN